MCYGTEEIAVDVHAIFGIDIQKDESVSIEIRDFIIFIREELKE